MKKYLCSYKSPGAIFFGVCGGKLSEGIDFSDDMARLVIIVGIPFGYMGDSRNKSKMEYLDTMSSRVQDARYKLSGKKWYDLKAMRSMSQAIGRVIRHKNDYGAILLLDERMESKIRLAQLSSWIKDEVKVEEQFIKVIKPLKLFFKEREEHRAEQVSILEKQAIEEYEEGNNTRIAPVLIQRQVNLIRPQTKFQAPLIKPTENKTKTSDFASGIRSHYTSHSFSNLGGAPINDFMLEDQNSRSRMFALMGSDEKENSQSNPMHQNECSNSYHSRFMDSIKTVKPEMRKASVPPEEVPGHTLRNLAMLDEKIDSQELKANPELCDKITKMYKMLNPSEQKEGECKICCEKRQLMSVPCGHIACSYCWDQIALKLKESGKSKRMGLLICPFCKVETSKVKLRKIYT